MTWYLFLLSSLLIRVAAAQAQPALAFNNPRQPDEPGVTQATPRHAKATDAPFYVKIYGFYGLLTPGGTIDYSYQQTQTTAPTVYKATDKSLGAGSRAGVGLGYIVSDFINLGIDADIFFGSALPINSSFFSGTSSYTTARTTALKVLSITPNVTFKALSRPAYYIYNRLGLTGGVVLDYKTTGTLRETSSKGVVTTTVSTTDYTKNSLALGYQVAFGIQFRLSQSLRGFAEIVAYNQSFKPQESTSISTTSGVAKAQSNTTVYKDQGDYSKTDPDEQPSFNAAINSVGGGAGLVFRF